MFVKRVKYMYKLMVKINYVIATYAGIKKKEYINQHL